ncbi:hypothetical protein [Flavobacterium sp.]|uniref:hypothetical protein n=1 Tax=Flavobacterium sp. TaxID=239 RepID=UPI002C0A0DA9|nr:hypothetical protein [Flavobacterium sp.]HSD08285.1 hypothetical protein [Flavobacterium sp.]
MSDYNPADIPATEKFQTEVKLLQEEYKTSLKTGEHVDKQFETIPLIVGNYFGKQCEIIYETKLNQLCREIIEFHKNSSMSHIDLIEYPRFKELLWDARYKTHTFLETL